MATMILEVYDAFRSIGIDDERARQAAGALSDNPRAIGELRADMTERFNQVHTDMTERFNQVHTEMAQLRAEVTQQFNQLRIEDIAKLRTEQMVLRTMLGIVIAGVLSIVLKLYI